MWESFWCFLKSHLWELLTSVISAIGVFIMGLIIKSKADEVSIRLLHWMIAKSKDRLTGLPISPSDIDNVYPKTRIEKMNECYS